MKKINQAVFVSATPGKIEKELSTKIAEQVIRPTGLLDPEIEVVPTKGQIDHLEGEIKKRVEAARERARRRGVSCNAHLTGKALHELIRLSPDATDLLKSVFDSLGLTGRSYDKILKLALTIADLADSDTVEAFHIAEAIQYRSLDRSDD